MNSMKDLLTIMEGKKTRHQQILESFQHAEYRNIYKEWYEIGSVITEAQISQEQVQAIFKAIADGAKNGGNTDAQGNAINNRTFLGKGADAASKISKAWDNFKTKIAQSGPVSGFDVAFDKAQSQLLNSVGGDKGAIGKALQSYKNFATKYPKMQGAIYAGIAILVGISGWGLGGAAVLAGIRTLDRLLQGDRASSALWQGFKTGAMTVGAQQASQFISGLGGHTGTTPTDYGSDYGPGETPGGTSYTTRPGDTLSGIADRTHTSVNQIMQQNPGTFTNPGNPDVLGTGQDIKLAPAYSGEHVYQGGVGTNADTMSKIGTGQYGDSAISQAGAAKAAAAKAAAAKAAAARAAAAKIAPGVMAESIDYAKIKSVWALQESLKLPLRSSVYLTPYGVDQVFRKCEQQIMIKEGLWDGIKKTAKAGWESATNKITYDKLNLWWKKNHGDQTAQGPVDTQEVMDFLKKMGVGDTLINKVFTDLKIPTSSTVAPNDVSVPPETPAAGSTANTAGAGAFNAMAGNLKSMAPPETSSTGGSTQQTATGLKHTASPTNPNQPGAAPASSAAPAAPAKITPDVAASQLKQLWDKLMDADAPVGAPAVRQQLKSMWMSAGGTGAMAESKKRRR